MAWYLSAGQTSVVFAPGIRALIIDYLSLLVFLIGIGATCLARRGEMKESQFD